MKKTVNVHPNTFSEGLLDMIVTEFTEKSLLEFSEELDKIRASKQPIIPITIDSFGGTVYQLIGMLSLLENTQETIVTYTGSKAMSCGIVLLAAGTPGYRFMAPHAIAMLHPVSYCSIGKIGDQIVTAEHGNHLNEQILSILSKKAKKKPDFFKQYLKKRSDRDVYLTARECLELGIIDKIGVPNITVDIAPRYEIICE